MSIWKESVKGREMKRGDVDCDLLETKGANPEMKKEREEVERRAVIPFRGGKERSVGMTCAEDGGGGEGWGRGRENWDDGKGV